MCRAVSLVSCVENLYKIEVIDMAIHLNRDHFEPFVDIQKLKKLVRESVMRKSVSLKDGWMVSPHLKISFAEKHAYKPPCILGSLRLQSSNIRFKVEILNTLG